MPLKQVENIPALALRRPVAIQSAVSLKASRHGQAGSRTLQSWKRLERSADRAACANSVGSEEVGHAVVRNDGRWLSSSPLPPARRPIQ
jgi:hypothetical protein